MHAENLQWNVIQHVRQQCHLPARAVFSILKNDFQEDVFLFHSKSNIRLSVFVVGKGGGGGSLLLNKRLFTILSFELNIEISLKTCTPMTYECGELTTSKWGPKLLSTPRGGLLTGDCEKPANTRTTSGQHPRTT